MHLSPEYIDSNKLPDKPSELIRLALSDLAKCEQDNTRYIIDMHTYYLRDGKYCVVCLAGSVMAQTLEGNFDYVPNLVKTTTDCQKLYALNAFRVGDVADGLTCMYEEQPEFVPLQYEVPRYEDDKEGFKSSLYHIAGLLEVAGL
jgi:hypothetical protein